MNDPNDLSSREIWGNLALPSKPTRGEIST